MPIIEHPTVMHTVPGRFYPQPTYVAKCELCSNTCSKVGHVPGDAAEEARKKGWATRKAATAKIGDPKIWVCAGCIKVETAKVKA
jgi:hypothetical protein